MYGIFAYIYHKNQPNVCKYPIHDMEYYSWIFQLGVHNYGRWMFGVPETHPFHHPGSRLHFQQPLLGSTDSFQWGKMDLFFVNPTSIRVKIIETHPPQKN